MELEERRDALRYLMLLALEAAVIPRDYRDLIPDVDVLELRSTSNWLIENGYASWVGGGVAITEQGRQLIASVHWADRRSRRT